MLVDTHVHTLPYSPCSVLAREELLPLALERGLGAVIVTDHGRQWEAEELRALQDSFASRGLLLLNGAEVASDVGHVLVYGCRELPCHGQEAARIVERVHAQGGVAVLAHPFRHGQLADAAAGELATLFGLFDGVEVLNGNLSPEELQRGLKARDQVGFAALGGSDAHSAWMVGRYLTETPPLAGMADFVRAVREGRLRPVANPQLGAG